MENLKVQHSADMRIIIIINLLIFTAKDPQ